MKTEQAFNVFLNERITQIRKQTIELRRAIWELETTGQKTAAEQVAKLSTELKLLYSSEETYHKLIDWKKEGTITSPELLRTLNLMIKRHKANLAPKELLGNISALETEVIQTYVAYRSEFEGQSMTENDLVDILKSEKNIERRKNAWEATKKVGKNLAPLLLKLVKARNELAHRAGYSDFYKMKLELDEVDFDWLFKFLDQFDEASKEAYSHLSSKITENLAKEFETTLSSIGPWAWKDPFSQEDPLISDNLDLITKDLDIVKTGKKFFASMGFNVEDIINQSDLFERSGKNQHAFCINIDREKDIRILTNIRPNMRWLETLIHELGHAVYEMGYDPQLPWYLKEPPHMITTEAMALISGRHAYDGTFLKNICANDHLDQYLDEAHESLKRRQLIFSRWALVMIHFEAKLYANPEQNLNELWWQFVQKYQRICPPSLRGDDHDWACKCHFGIAPVYYHSYLLGEFLASMLKAQFEKINHSPSMYNQPQCSQFLNEKLFFSGNRLPWDQLVMKTFNEPLEFKSWLKDFGT